MRYLLTTSLLLLAALGSPAGAEPPSAGTALAPLPNVDSDAEQNAGQYGAATDYFFPPGDPRGVPDLGFVPTGGGGRDFPTYSTESDTFSYFADPYPPGVRPPHTRKTFHIPRTRPWDWQYDKYLGGGPIVQALGHGPNRPGVWDCFHHIVPQPPRKWTVEADALLLRRDRERPLTVLRSVPANESLLSMEELDFDYVPGPQVSARWHMNQAHSIEAAFFTLEQWNSSAVIDDAGPIRFEGAGLSIISPTQPFVARYRSSLQSGEVNLRVDMRAYSDELSFFAGFHWFDFGDEFRIGILGVPAEVNIETDNALQGFQMGVQSRAWAGYGIVRLDSTLKGGVYQNQIDQDASLGPAAFNDQTERVTWVGQAAVTAVAPATKNFWLRGGYQIIYFNGVATARNQLQTTDLTVPITAIDSSGTALFHGFYVGVEGWW